MWGKWRVPILLALLAAVGAAQSLDPQTSVLLIRGIAALGAEPQAGWIAAGTATLSGSHGEESGAITVEVWGASHCKITIDLLAAAGRRRYEAIENGQRYMVRGARGAEPAPPAVGRALGCALLPQGLLLAGLATGSAVAAGVPAASGGAAPPADQVALGQPGAPAVLTLALDPSSGLPSTSAWSSQGPAGKVRQITVSYSDYQASSGVSYPATVVESVDGAARLTIHFTSLTAHSGFTDADFPLPPAGAEIVKHGGGQ